MQKTSINKIHKMFTEQLIKKGKTVRKELDTNREQCAKLLKSNNKGLNKRAQNIKKLLNHRIYLLAARKLYLTDKMKRTGKAVYNIQINKLADEMDYISRELVNLL